MDLDSTPGGPGLSLVNRVDKLPELYCNYVYRLAAVRTNIQEIADKVQLDDVKRSAVSSLL
ncbi:hypothetical protein FIBSPDRAFT_873198 [Athelia psychrophila]|uniref:Uncharacterized protein n=1 Tax=Athelia psychrophila TaxID=1759441 RepID=A0A165YR46_9AGAM|nr:hypothetical protein FIBSPDRAFT_873198 [Fibularhizoctonia sp. CBS 109695]